MSGQDGFPNMGGYGAADDLQPWDLSGFDHYDPAGITEEDLRLMDDSLAGLGNNNIGLGVGLGGTGYAFDDTGAHQQPAAVGLEQDLERHMYQPDQGSRPRINEKTGNLIFEYEDGDQLWHPAVLYYFKAPNPWHDPTGAHGPAMYSNLHPVTTSPAGPSSKKRKLAAGENLPRKTTARTPRKRSSDVAFACSCTYSPKVPRPKNVFLLFRLKAAPMIKRQNPGIAFDDQSKLLSKQWAAMSDQEKEPYHQMAKTEAQEHARKNPQYKYDPKKAKKQKAGIEGRCTCGAFDKNRQYKLLRSRGVAPDEAYEQVERTLAAAPTIAAPGSDHSIFLNRQQVGNGDVLANYDELDYADGEETDISRRLWQA